MGYNQPGRELTVVFDRGMNSKENIAFIDGRKEIHFITTYSTYFAEALASIDSKHFDDLDIPKNRRLTASGRDDDQIKAFSSTLTPRDRERIAVVTFNPATMRKKVYPARGGSPGSCGTKDQKAPGANCGVLSLSKGGA